MTASEVVVVANPAAGRGKGGRLIGKVGRMLHEAGVPHAFRVSGSADGLTEQVRRAADDGVGTIAVLGGDGSVGLAANGILDTGATLAVLPSGTGDDFAHSLGVGSLAAAVRALADPNVVPIDVVRVTTGTERRVYVNVAGAGFDSDVTEAANAMRLGLGPTGTYIASVVKTLSRFVPAGYRVQLDDEVVEGPHMLVVVANAVSYGGGMKVAPRASVVDGCLDVLLLRALGKGAFLRAFPKVFRGTHVRHPAVTMATARTVAIETDRRVQVYADGERVGPLPARFEVLPAALPIVVGVNPRAIP
ncbi:MAG TPA: diacylglycerol kinase family protein [Actinomycetota bacterium]|nr:diacylglycerol kinase family protein [Actinomycetota bacterium]